MDRKIVALKTTSNTLVHNTRAILDEFKTFYSSLYTSKKPEKRDIDKFLTENSLLDPLTVEHQQWMDEPITELEVLRAIKKMKNNKSPGPDGYPVEFYKVFVSTLSPVLVKTFNNVMQSGSIPTTWRYPF